VGLPSELWELVRERLTVAVAGLELAGTYGAVQIVADDLPGDDDAWYRLLPGPDGPELAISCHVDSFCRRRHLQTTVYPVRPIWDQFEAPLIPQIPDESTYSAQRTDMFLHHHLLTVEDLRQGTLHGDEIPRRLVEAFAAVWAVAVDGRLARRHLPGYEMAERRSRFSRLFSTGGILMPNHWQMFQAVWDGAMPDQTAVLGAIRRLPRL